jgi:solute carrier family 25 (mitochondrial phosphate transporter), member 23/24/25/41
MVQGMYKEGGVGAFYRGLLAEYLKVIPGVAIAFCSYEVMKTFLFQ